MEDKYLKNSIVTLWVLCLISAVATVILAYHFRIATDEYITLQTQFHNKTNFYQLLVLEHNSLISFIELGNIAQKQQLTAPIATEIINIYVDK